MTVASFAAIAAAIALAGLAQGATGIGFALIVAPVLAYLRPDLMPVMLIVLMIPLNLYVAWRERHAIDRRGAGWVTSGRLVGTFGGLWVLAVLPLDALDLLIGWSTVLAVLVSVAAPAFSAGPKTFTAAGLVTGVTETATGVGGPPLALVYQHHAPQSMRATIATCFLVGEVLSLAVLALSGRVDTAQLSFALLFLPPMAAGVWVSKWMHHRIEPRRLRQIVLAFAFASGVLLVV